MIKTLYMDNGFPNELNTPTATKHVSPAYASLESPYFDSIQDAIDDLGEDTGLVIVFPGIYEEKIVLSYDSQHLFFHDGAIVYADEEATGYIIEINADYCSIRGYLDFECEKTEADHSMYLNGIAMGFDAKKITTPDDNPDAGVCVIAGAEVLFNVARFESEINSSGSVSGRIHKLRNLVCADSSLTNLIIELLTGKASFSDTSIADVTIRISASNSQSIECTGGSNVTIRGMRSQFTSAVSAAINVALVDASPLGPVVRLMGCNLKNSDLSGTGQCVSVGSLSKLLLHDCILIAAGSNSITGDGYVKYLTQTTLNKSVAGGLTEYITSNKVVSSDAE